MYIHLMHTKQNLHETKMSSKMTKGTSRSWQKGPLDLDKRDLHALQGNSNVRNIGDHRAKKPPQQLF